MKLEKQQPSRNHPRILSVFTHTYIQILSTFTRCVHTIAHQNHHVFIEGSLEV